MFGDAKVYCVGLDIDMHKAILENIYENTNDYTNDTFILLNFVKKRMESLDLKVVADYISL